MKTIEIESWETYCSEIDKLQHKYESVPVLFRGQANSSWPLRTTLERFSKASWTIRKYCDLVLDCIPEAGSPDDCAANIPSLSDFRRELDELNKNMSRVLVPIPNSISFYWTYLRHYGFPSPLLDWTSSPYIAAFFAFCESGRTNKVAIFAFVDSVSDQKAVWLGKPQITAKWLNMFPHKRHTRQQCGYTIATKAKGNDHQFARHEHVFRENETVQDILIKYVIPSTESMKAMKCLDETGINHGSLMDDREAHLKTLAFRKIRLKGL